MISKNQIDKLGERLRKGNASEEDLRLLDDYRRSFTESYEFVVKAIREELGLEPTGRPAKSTTAIQEKLLRESIRLSQIQDIAGCRLLVHHIANQQQVVESLVVLFENGNVIDRREQPSHGYRAVHVIVEHREKVVEVQIRTLLQHSWAELSEKLSDIVDPAIKYGKGDRGILDVLLQASSQVAQEESQEVRLASLERKVSDTLSKTDIPQDRLQELLDLQTEIKDAQVSQVSIREGTLAMLRHIIERLPNGGDDNVISD